MMGIQVVVGEGLVTFQGIIMKKLYRSSKDKMLSGLCGGFGETFSIDPTLVRLVFVFLFVSTGFLALLIAYIVGWMIVPKDEEKGSV